jgi:hypothetical protein
LLRQLHPVALDRFCQRVLSDAARLASAAEPGSHERYLALFDLIRRRNRELSYAFDDLRPSTALVRSTFIQSHELLTDEEFGRFTEATREAVQLLQAARPT